MWYCDLLPAGQLRVCGVSRSGVAQGHSSHCGESATPADLWAGVNTPAAYLRHGVAVGLSRRQWHPRVRHLLVRVAGCIVARKSKRTLSAKTWCMHTPALVGGLACSSRASETPPRVSILAPITSIFSHRPQRPGSLHEYIAAGVLVGSMYHDVPEAYPTGYGAYSDI